MFTESLSDFFALDDFAQDATWSGNAAAPVQVIFDNGYYETFGVAGRQPTATVADAQVPGVATGQTLTIAGTVYTIVGVEPDGTGVTVLRLRA